MSRPRSVQSRTSSVCFAILLPLLSLGLALGAASCGDSKPSGGTGGSGGRDGSAPDGASPDGASPDAGDDGPPATAQKLVILHTNDIHSHLMGFGPERDYTPATPSDDTTRGGIARLATAIGAARASAAASSTPVLLLDGGDFMMGSLFELLAKVEIPELVLMK